MITTNSSLQQGKQSRNNLNEIFDSGIDEYFNNESYCLIENPGEIGKIISHLHHRIKIYKKTNSNMRVIEFLN